MVILHIQGEDGIEQFKLFSNARKQLALKRELLGRFKDDTEITIFSSTGEELDKILLKDLF